MFRSKKLKPSLKVLWHGSNIKQQHHLNPSALITSKNSNLLDKGQFGQIYKGQYLRRNIAIKTINLKHDDETIKANGFKWCCCLIFEPCHNTFGGGFGFLLRNIIYMNFILSNNCNTLSLHNYFTNMYKNARICTG